jgi:hypothetical protein
MSLAVPGAGQLLARHWSCLGWFLTAVLLGFLSESVAPDAAWVRFAALAVLGLFSAEHAKRCLEPRQRPAGVAARVSCGPFRGRAVNLRIELDVPRPPAAVWALVADFQRFACIDPFHSRVIVLGPALQPGVDLALEHRAFGVRLLRFGRLLYWRHGQGYAFSDLSARGPGHGFPHVFFVSVLPAACGEQASRLRVEVRGKWTARWLPLLLGQWWLRYVCHEHARLLRAALADVVDGPGETTDV